MKARRNPRRRTITTTGGGGGTAPPEPECGGATYTFGTGITEIDGWPGGGDYTQTYEPGAILEITNGSRSRLRIRNVQGTAECPITIRNSSGGAVVFTSTSDQGMLIQNCRYVIIDGSGASGVTYGFQCTAATGNKGMEIGMRSIHVVVNNVEIGNCGNIGLFVHTKLDGSYDYEESSPGTPSTFSGADAWTDEDFEFFNLYWHDTGSEGCYIGNNHAKRDDVPDMTEMYMHDCTGSLTDLEAFDFKTMTEGRCDDCSSNDGGQDNVTGSAAGVRFGVGSEITLTRHTDIDPLGQNYWMAGSWRRGELVDSSGENAMLDSVRASPSSSEEEDGGSILIDNYTSTAPAKSAIDTNIGNSVAAAASLIIDCSLEHDAARDCIQHDDEIITETNNTCTPV
jgi:hypothetical protein